MERERRLVRIAECLDIDLATDQWCCNRCGHELGDARKPYKLGCLLRERNPHEIHPPLGTNEEYNFSFHPDWIRIIEFYCPKCATMIENEYLPPGHPLTWDIEVDVDELHRKAEAELA
jgi:acetone carboxylase gamma subunit